MQLDSLSDSDISFLDFCSFFRYHLKHCLLNCLGAMIKRHMSVSFSNNELKFCLEYSTFEGKLNEKGWNEQNLCGQSCQNSSCNNSDSISYNREFNFSLT